jgi:hypothetical protein
MAESACRAGFSGRVLIKTFAVTVVVGALLNAINQRDTLLKDPKTVVLCKVASHGP